MTSEEVLDLFRSRGALLEGHFQYTSGRHGERFLQASRILQYPDTTGALCGAIADRFRESKPDLVCGPATGGIILSYETGRHLNCRAVFSEKEDDGTMAVKRGFRVDPGTRVVVVEDIVTTGGSVLKTVDHLRSRGAEVIGIGVLVDRSGGDSPFGDIPYHPLAHITLTSHDADTCPLCEKGEPLVEPDDIAV